MYKLELITREEKVEMVVQQLSNLGYPGLSITQVEGRGQQGGIQEQFRGRAYTIPFLTKYKIEVIVRDDDLEKVKASIIKATKTGDIGDGKIFIYPISEVIRIRTEETGEEAI